MKRQSCGHENREGASFCDECGAALERSCPNCSSLVRPAAKFCDECGQALGARAVDGPSTTARTPTPAPALPAAFGGGRYQVQRFIGEGGKKRVYLAHDSRLERDVAVALVKTDGLTEESAARIQREGQAMGQLGGHPHIVTAHDLGEEAGQPYIVMEYMAGGDLETLLRSADGAGLSLADALRIGGEVCQALEHAHEQGIIHRDLKPGNIWLTDPSASSGQGPSAGSGLGTAKLGDFGFVLAPDRSRLTQAGMMVGTPYCMPPEQALGAEVTAASDLYSLGCVLYEMVAGRPPFPGDDPTAVISQHINNAPVAPSWYTDHCPPDLEELILHLLAKAPEDRPATATEVREALGRIDPTQRSASHTEANVLERLARGVFVGREKELDGLRKAFDEAFAGHGSIVMLVGEPGIGKTRSAQELETHARMRGAQVLWGLSHEAAGAPAYWPWMQVGRTYGSSHDVLELAADMEGAGPDLVHVFPELRQIVPEFQEPEAATDAESAQFRLFDAYTRFVRAMAARSPLLIALDDLHWTDKGSLLLLQHLARELGRMRVLIVCTYRDTDLVRTHPLSEALAALNRESGFQRIALRGLTRDECASYIKTAANVQPAPSVIDKIFEETEGNPFFLSEVVNLMAQEGTLTRDSVSDIAIPDGVREALGRRLNRISEEANELLQVAAVAGSEFTYETLSLLEERDEDELLRLVEEALEARVIEEMDRPGRYKFTHAQMQETLLGELSTTRRVRLHGRIGEALEKRYGERASERPAPLAGHFVEAAMLTPRHAEKAVRYSKLAAAQSEEQAAWDVAAKHYENCLTLVSEAEDKLGEDEAALLVKFGTCARNTGEYRPAMRSLMRARTLYQERGKPAGLAEATLEACLILAPPQRHFPLVQEALAELGDSEPHLEARLLAVLIGFTGLVTDEERERARARLKELVEAHGFEDVQAAILQYDGQEAGFAGRPDDAVRLNREAYERFAQLGDAREAAAAISASSGWVVMLGDLDGAQEATQETLTYSRDHHIRWYEESAASVLGGILLARCDYAAFDALAGERAADVGYPIHAYRVLRAEMSGELERAVTLLPDPAVAGGNPMFTSHIHAVRARVFLTAGQEAQARDEFQRMREMLQLMPNSNVVNGVALHPPANAFLDEALPFLADEAYVDATVELFSQERGTLGTLQFDPFSLRSIPRVRGSSLLLRGELDEAEQLLSRGLEECERERCPVEAGRCLQGLAEVTEKRGDEAEALRLLDRAAALFQEHGAKLYLGRVIAKKVKLQGITSGDIKTSIDAVAAIVQSEQPALPAKSVAPDGTVTLLFSDIEDSTPLNERLGDRRWMEVLREHNGLVREQVQAQQGYEVKTEGDGFMVAFGSARSALQCAIGMQREFARRNESSEEPLQVRIGLHTGEAIQDEGDFYGMHVNLAARIASQAEGGEILVSSLLKELTQSAGDISFGDERSLVLKGLSGAQTVHVVKWDLP